MSQLKDTSEPPASGDKQRPHGSDSTKSRHGLQTDTFDDGFHAKVAPVPFSAQQFPMSHGYSPQAWKGRPRSPGLRWYKDYNSPESLKNGRVLVVDYVKKDHSKEGMRKVTAQEISSVDGLRKLYASPDRCEEAVLRVIHCQNADWATGFLLHKFNINARDDLVGTDFGKYVKYKRPERRGGKPFLSGKSWKTIHDPWRGISRTSFGLDYLKQYQCPKIGTKPEKLDVNEKMMELNCYDEDDNPAYGFDVYVQRLSCYIQHKEPAQDVPTDMYPDIQNPYKESTHGIGIHKYVPDVSSLDNGNTIIVFENSQSGSIEDTMITARQTWESRWRRLPFYLAYESHDVSNDDRMALECMKIILGDVWKSIAQNWEDLLDVCNTHVSILEDKIYEQPADESRAPELWTNSSMWLKVERLVSIHVAIVKEMQTNLRELTGEPDVEDNWLESSPDDMQKISDLVQEDLTKPTANLADLMYKSVGIRDSRHGLQLNTSMWRLSWITFIFLPLTFISSFFGMNVDIFKSDPSIRWYFASAIPMMIIVLVLWYFIKHSLARRRQTPYQRGIYEHLFFELATAYPRLWSRSGPEESVEPQNILDRLRWHLIVFWNNSAKTIGAGPSDSDAEYDDLGAWSRFKRTLTRRWTSQIHIADNESSSTTTLEEGGADQSSLMGNGSEKATKVVAVQPHESDLPSGMLEVPLPQTTFMLQHTVSSRPSSAERPSSKGGSSNRNSGVMVEEEAPTWLQEFGRRGRRSASLSGRSQTVNVEDPLGGRDRGKVHLF